mmetsp:Transcript_69379/g.225283  ORF Transcript_69379/g.225283 Transcript_69379/m.225283 type:complete len:341 (-) Transcript_69379:944-1966(-)
MSSTSTHLLPPLEAAPPGAARTCRQHKSGESASMQRPLSEQSLSTSSICKPPRSKDPSRGCSGNSWPTSAASSASPKHAAAGTEHGAGPAVGRAPSAAGTAAADVSCGAATVLDTVRRKDLRGAEVGLGQAGTTGCRGSCPEAGSSSRAGGEPLQRSDVAHVSEVGSGPTAATPPAEAAAPADVRERMSSNSLSCCRCRSSKACFRARILLSTTSAAAMDASQATCSNAVACAAWAELAAASPQANPPPDSDGHDGAAAPSASYDATAVGEALPRPRFCLLALLGRHRRSGTGDSALPNCCGCCCCCCCSCCSCCCCCAVCCSCALCCGCCCRGCCTSCR